MADDLREFILQGTFRREYLDLFLNPEPAEQRWARHDPELGYLPSTCSIREGLDGCCTFNTFAPDGSRRMIQFAERPCRVNTYGDSFTQCDQVSDGETWQEYLAGHIGEPIRNFGVSSFGVYQAFLRARREESGPRAAGVVVLNIYHDDHHRNLEACRWLHCGFNCLPDVAHRRKHFFGVPWAHLRFDIDSGGFEELPNPAPEPDDLYELCEPDAMYERFRHDRQVRLDLLERGGQVDETGDLQAIAAALGLDADLGNPERRAADARRISDACSLRSTCHVLDLAADWAKSNGKRLVVALSYGGRKAAAAIRGEPRFDRVLLEHLERLGLVFFDGLAAHLEDWRDFSCTPEEYVRRYWIGHYAPAGNHFFAFAISGVLVATLDPPPPALAGDGTSLRAWAESRA